MVERILFAPGGATEVKQDTILTSLTSLLTELQQKYEGGAIELGAATLTALESITAVVSGPVALDAPTLAALETISATITNLPADYPDAAAIALLGSLEALLSAPLAVTGPLTDAQLRASPAPITATDLDIRDLILGQDSVRQTLRTSLPASVAITGSVTDQVLVSIAAGDRIRLIRNAGHVDPALGAEIYPLVTMKIGATVIWRDKLETGLPWSETVCFEGAAGEDLTISIDTAATVYLNCRYEVFGA